MSGILQGLTGSFYSVSGGDYESIATSSGLIASGIVDFTSIPQTYKHLQIRVYVTPQSSDQVSLRMGSGSIDTGNNYNRHVLFGNGTTVGNGGQANSGYGHFYGFTIVGSTTFPTISIVDILDYTNTNIYTTYRGLSGCEKNATSEIDFVSGAWMNTAAVDRIRVFSESASNWISPSHVALYGLKG